MSNRFRKDASYAYVIVITYFKHLNIRIAKNYLAYPLLKDTCLGSY